ncbi:TPA: conjugal transfer protein TraN [Vibrio parahaemolyticus]
MKLLYVLFFILYSSLSLEAAANPFYESIHCIDEKASSIGQGDIAQCISASSDQYLCPIDSVACNQNDNFDAEPPECDDPKSFDSVAGLCSETLVNPAQCPSGSSLSDNRCNGLLTQNASCPKGQTLKDDKCSATLSQSAGCPAGQTLQNDVCTATLTDSPKCPSGQSFNTSTGQCSQTIFNDAQCPSGSSLSNDRCNGLLVQNARCPSGQSLKNGVCTVTLNKAPSCSSGYTYNASKDRCEKTTSINITQTCQSGFSLVGGICKKEDVVNAIENCPSNSQWNEQKRKCEVNVCEYNSGTFYFHNRYGGGGCWLNGKEVSCSNYSIGGRVKEENMNTFFELCYKGYISKNVECPSGYTYKEGFCSKTTTHPPINSCPSGYTQNGSKCDKTQITSPLCQSGYGYNFSTNKCEKTVNSSPMCNSGYSFNPSSNKCEKAINTAPMCAQGYTYSPTHNRCMKTVTSSPFCQSGYTYNNVQKLCSKVVSTAPLCESGYGYNFSTNRCEKVITSAPICQTGYHYNVTTDRCEREIDADPICPTGYDFNPKSDKCEKVVTDEPQCESGYGYNPETKQCEKSWVTESCPYGSEFQCIPNGGASYCSPNRCFDPNTEKVEEDDDIDGSMLLDNGEVNADGICMDQVYIFNGRAQKCRTKGVQTAFKDCCESDGKVLKDGGGSSAQSQMTSASIQAIYQASAAAYNAYSAGATMAEAGNAFTSGFVGAFDPTSLAVSIAIAIVMDYLAKACDQIETETALANSSSMCVYVGEYCKEKWLGRCVQKAKSYCCFNSQLAKIINEQGRSQLKSFENVGNRGFGEVKSPQCRGFTPEEFQALDFSNIDLTDYYEEITHRAQSEVQETMESMTEEYFNNVN